MQNSLQLTVIFLLFALFQMPAHASKTEEKRCFNFDAKNLTPLIAPPTEFASQKDIFSNGKKKDESADWATIQGVIQKPIHDLYRQLLDPKTIRNGDNVKVTVKDIESKNYLHLIEQSVALKPTFFLMLKWKELWGYALKEGTAEQPKSILLSYEKIEGTTHIDHFCGNILLQSLPAKTKNAPAQTGVFIYQEMKASHRDAKNILDDITGTMRTLRQ